MDHDLNEKLIVAAQKELTRDDLPDGERRVLEHALHEMQRAADEAAPQQPTTPPSDD